MVEYDAIIGRLLDKIDALGIKDDTIVIYTTDNGPMVCRPDAGMTPFRSEKDTGYEGAFRVPCLIRWPGVVAPGTVITDMVASEDWLTTLLAAAGEPDIKAKCLKGHKAGQLHDRQGPRTTPETHAGSRITRVRAVAIGSTAFFCPHTRHDTPPACRALL
jgi:arylsulfatase